MDINDQRDYAEEDYNRAALEKEGIEEALAEVQEMKGSDLSFLISKKGQDPYVANIRDLVESLESDAFYHEEEARIVGARFFLVTPGEAPVEAYPIYLDLTSDEAWITKIMKIHIEDGDVIASASYKIPTWETLNG